MNPIRVFAKMAARVPPPGMQPGSTGTPEVDAATAGALCAGMSKHAYNMALAKFAHDESVAQWLMVELWRVAMERAQRDRWGTAGRKVARCGNRHCAELAASLSGAALASFDEAMDVTSGSDYTRVVAEIIVRETYYPGFWSQNDSWQWRAAMLGVGKSVYFETWRKRVQSVGASGDSWAGDAIRHLWMRQAE